MSVAYGETFERMLAEVADVATDPVAPLVPFWPLRGSLYDGDLLVIGRSVNGWVDDWTVGQLRDPAQRRAAVDWLRRDAEPIDSCRMQWVTDLWGAQTGYNTHRSAFWRVLRRIVLSDPATDPTTDRWSRSPGLDEPVQGIAGSGLEPGRRSPARSASVGGRTAQAGDLRARSAPGPRAHGRVDRPVRGRARPRARPPIRTRGGSRRAGRTSVGRRQAPDAEARRSLRQRGDDGLR